MTRLISALIAVLALGQPALPIEIRDVEGRRWTVLTPSSNQLDLLFFVSTDCPISNRYAPEINRTCADYRARGVHCFLVYPDPSADSASVNAHRQAYGLDRTIPAVLDPGQRLVGVVGPRVTPEAAIYSSAGRRYRGRIDDLYIDVGRARRQATRHDVRSALDAALAGQPIPLSETEAVGCFIPKRSG